MKPGPKPITLTEEQEQFVRLSWGRVSQRRMADLLDVSTWTVRKLGYEMGLPRLRRGQIPAWRKTA